MDNTTLIIKYTDQELDMGDKKKFEKDLYLRPELMREYQFHTRLNSFMKGKFMYENAKKDKHFDDADNFAKEALIEHNKSEIADKEIFDFINEHNNYKRNKLDNKIKFVERESYDKGLDKLTYNWVQEWKEEEKDTDYINDLRDYVADGIKMNTENTSDLRVVKNGQTKNKSIFLKQWYYVAASIAAIFIVSFSLLNYFEQPASNSEIFASYYQPYNLVSSQTRGADLDVESTLNKATLLYKSNNFEEASKLFEEVIKADNEHVKAHFLFGLTQIEIENYLIAAEKFNFIILKHDSYNIEAKWYLALCYVKLEKTEKAKPILKELTESKNYYNKFALEILTELN